MGDKGQKDKDKGQKQHAAKDKQEEKKKRPRLGIVPAVTHVRRDS